MVNKELEFSYFSKRTYAIDIAHFLHMTQSIYLGYTLALSTKQGNELLTPSIKSGWK